MLYLHPDFITNWNVHTLEDVQNFCGKGDLVSSSSCSHVWKRKSGDHIVFVKKYDYPHSFRYFLRASKAYCEWQNYQFFQQHQIECPLVLCYAEQRKWGRLRWAVIVTQEISHSTDLWELFRFPESHPLALDPRKMILQELAQKLAKLHSLDFFHHDCKLRNFLYQDTTQRLYLIDCPRGGKTIRPAFYTRNRDLKELKKHAKQVWSGEEWQYFLQEYQHNL